MAGFFDLGAALTGTKGAKADAYVEGQAVGAKTQQALQDARLRRQKGDANAAALGIDYSNVDDVQKNLGQLLVAELGGQFDNARAGLNKQQQYDLTGRVADPATEAEARFRAQQALKPDLTQYDFSDNAVGNKITGASQTTDLGDSLIAKNAAGPEDTQQARNYRTLIGLDPSRAGADTFSDILRGPQIGSAGGVPTLFQTRPGQAPVATTPVGVTDVANNVGTIAGAKTTAVDQAKALQGLPAQLESVKQFEAAIDKFTKAPGFDTVYGTSSVADPRMYIRGSDAQTAEAMRKNLEGKAFEDGVQTLRGLGALSDAEGAALKAAYTIATSPNVSEEEARVAWDDVKTRLATARENAYLRAGQAPAQPPAAPGAAPAAPGIGQSTNVGGFKVTRIR